MDNSFFILLLCCLGVFRCAEAITKDNGPFHIFLKLRNVCKNHPVLCEFITCFYCLSGWLSIIAAAWLVWAGFVLVAHAVLWWGAIWGGAAAVFRVVRERT